MHVLLRISLAVGPGVPGLIMYHLQHFVQRCALRYRPRPARLHFSARFIQPLLCLTELHLDGLALGDPLLGFALRQDMLLVLRLFL